MISTGYLLLHLNQGTQHVHSKQIEMNKDRFCNGMGARAT